jgi:hypothetical protein
MKSPSIDIPVHTGTLCFLHSAAVPFIEKYKNIKISP